MADSERRGWPWLWGKLFALLNRDPASNRLVVDLASLSPEDRVLDVGCGAGSALVLAAARVGAENVAGVDPTAALADTARNRLPGADIRVAVAEDLPFPDHSFTVAWAIASFHHWDDPEAGLTELGRVLAPRGRLLLAEAHKRRDRGHGFSDTEAEALARQLAGSGFEQVEIGGPSAGRHRFLVLTGHRGGEG